MRSHPVRRIGNGRSVASAPNGADWHCVSFLLYLLFPYGYNIVLIIFYGRESTWAYNVASSNCCSGINSQS